jgi:serine/threonine protein phosphatase 1
MWTRLTSAFGRNAVAPIVPHGKRIYAIGDIHGHLQLLDELLAQIVEDAARYPGFEKNLIFLGDYVDRGPESNGVLQRLCTLDLPGFNLVFLSGNHEEMMATFLEESTLGLVWLRNGGDATLSSYGIQVDSTVERTPEVMADYSRLLMDAVPRQQRDFLRALELTHEEGDYLFVHAGIRPGRSLALQEVDDLLWIREPFLKSRRDHGKVVVHGHSIRYEPEVYPDEAMPRRIGIDTGAYKNGVLTCLALVGDKRMLIQAGELMDSTDESSLADQRP